MEAAKVIAGEGEIAGVATGIDDQPLVQHIAHQPQAVLGEGVVDVAVNLVLVDALGEQLRDNEEDVGVAAVVGEAARVGHHAAVDGHGEVLAQLLEASQLPGKSENQLAGTAGLGPRDSDKRLHVWVEMMVYEDFLCG